MFSGRGFPAADLFCGLSGFSLGGVLAGGRWGPGLRGDRVWAGQAAVAGGPHAASNRIIHLVSWCQPSGRCKVMWPRPWRAIGLIVREFIRVTDLALIHRVNSGVCHDVPAGR